MVPNERAFNGKNYFVSDGKTVFRYRCIETPGKYRLKICFVSVGSPCDQGIAIRFSTKPSFSGNVFINGVRLPKPKKKHFSYVIQEGVFAENTVEVDLEIQEGSIAFSSASNYLQDFPEFSEKVKALTGKSAEQFEGKGFTSGFSAGNRYGNAFWVEQLTENCYRFHCNDHKMDDDFDDLIFDLEIESLSA